MKKMYVVALALLGGNVVNAQSLIQNVNDHHVFQVHFSGDYSAMSVNNGDAFTTAPELNDSDLANDPVLGMQNAVAGFDPMEKVVYDNAHARPSDQLSVLVRVKIDTAYIYDDVLSNTYYSIYQNGQNFIRILKQGAGSSLQFGVFNGHPEFQTYGYLVYEHALSTAEKAMFHNNFATFYLTYDATTAIMHFGYVAATPWSSSVSTNNGAGTTYTNKPLLYTAADTSLYLGTYPGQKFKGDIDYCYIYDTVLSTSFIASNYLLNIDENLIVAGNNELLPRFYYTLSTNEITYDWRKLNTATGEFESIPGATDWWYGANTSGRYRLHTTLFNFVTTVSEEVDVLIEDPVGINEQEYLPTIGVYPNPTSEFLIIEPALKSNYYVITNSVGRVITEGTLSPNQAIDVASLPNGAYFLHINEGIARFIKK